MECKIRAWNFSDAKVLPVILSDNGIRDNLRDGLPYPYAEEDGREFISAMLDADENDMFAFAVESEGKCIGSISVTRQKNIHRLTGELGYYKDKKSL